MNCCARLNCSPLTLPTVLFAFCVACIWLKLLMLSAVDCFATDMHARATSIAMSQRSAWGPCRVTRSRLLASGFRSAFVQSVPGAALPSSLVQSLLSRSMPALHCFIVSSSVVVCSPLRPCSGSCGVSLPFTRVGFALLRLRGSARACMSARAPVGPGVRHHPGPDACFRGRPGATMWVVVVGLPVSRR